MIITYGKSKEKRVLACLAGENVNCYSLDREKCSHIPQNCKYTFAKIPFLRNTHMWVFTCEIEFIQVFITAPIAMAGV